MTSKADLSKLLLEEEEGFKPIIIQHEIVKHKKSNNRLVFLYRTLFFLAFLCALIFALQQSWLLLKIYFSTTNNSSATSSSGLSPSFSIDYDNNVFLKDGQPFRYISGSIHYNRVPRVYWSDRLAKIKALGADAVQIYVPWNFHEFVEGNFHFDEERDIVSFIQLAQTHDLLVILRAGPYICAEWDFGGLPAWLLKKNASMVIRSSDPQYLAAVESWFNQLLPRIKPLLYENNGPIIMMQIENEYGSYYTCDMPYLDFLYTISRKHLGDNVILFTTDGYSAGYLKCGAMDKRTFATVDFGIDIEPADAFADLRAIRPKGPLVNSEFYVGWLDIWGVLPHQTVSIQSINKSMHSLLTYENRSVSVNMYMVHGGTTFAFWNGAEGNPFQPQVTSYDYDAPISEAGDTGAKYFALRSLFSQFKTDPLPPVPPNITKKAYGSIPLSERSNILTALNTPHFTIDTLYPISMESAGQYQGLLAYMTDIERPEHDAITLKLDRVGDTAYVFTSDSTFHWVNFLGRLNRSQLQGDYSVPPLHSKLIILLYNEGHINYGGGMFNDVKGIIGNVSVNGVLHTKWTLVQFNLEILPVYPTYPSVVFPQQASIHIGRLDIGSSQGVHDTFLKLSNFTKGIVHINGNNVGRFWNDRGPQQTLYVPKSFLREDQSNLIQVLELEGFQCQGSHCYVEFIDYPILNLPK